MIKSNHSLVKRRAKRSRRRSAIAAFRRPVGTVVAAIDNCKNYAAVSSAAAVMAAVLSPSSLVRRRRSRLAGCAALLSLLFVLMGGMGAPAPGLYFLRTSSAAARQASAIGRLQSLIDGDADVSSSPYFLLPVVNLWPNDAPVPASHANSHKGSSRRFVIASCTDHDPGADPCRLAQLNDEPSAANGGLERVGVLRSPGRIGMALEEAVQIMIVNQTEPAVASAGEAGSDPPPPPPRDVRLLPTSHVEFQEGAEGAAGPGRSMETYERIVRVATQPLLLDAMDLALEASESNDELTPDGVLCIVRLLVQWHCHHNRVTLNVAPVLAVSAHVLLSRPTEARKRLAWYLNRSVRDDLQERTIHEWMNAISHRVMRRIDECSAAATQLQRGLPVDQDLDELVQHVVQNEAAATCGRRRDADEVNSASASALTTARCESRGDGRLAEIAEILLSAPDAKDLRRRDAASLCGRFPSIRFCDAHLPAAIDPQILKQQR